MRFTKALVIVAAAALAAVSMAQPFGGGQGRRGGMFGGGMVNTTSLLMRRDVQNDLQLTDDQKTKLQSIGQEMFQKMGDLRQQFQGDREGMQKAMATIMADSQKQIRGTLTEDQQKRLKEIGVQFYGNSVALSEEYQKDLGITDDQATKFKALQEKQTAAFRAIGEKMRNGEIEQSEFPNLMKKNQDVMKAEIDKLLTDAQKTKLKDMAGKPFTRVDDQGGFGGFGGGFGRPGGGPGGN